ncbi:MAG: transcription repressor NadR [Sporolactobacillus sp.]
MEKSMRKKRVDTKKRRMTIIQMLKESDLPIKGGEIAERLCVSRQIIVQDVALLRAKGQPIIATSDGYLFLNREKNKGVVQRLIACKHTLEETERELTLIVNADVSIINVTVEHPLYGEITGSLLIRTHEDVTRFINRRAASGASLLSSLTGGVHLHLIEAVSDIQLDHAETALHEAGFLL